MMRFIKILPILFVLGVITLIVSCEDETTNPLDQVPTIPPQSSMVINFNEFPDTLSVISANNFQRTIGCHRGSARSRSDQ